MRAPNAEAAGKLVDGFRNLGVLQATALWNGNDRLPIGKPFDDTGELFRNG